MSMVAMTAYFRKVTPYPVYGFKISQPFIYFYIGNILTGQIKSLVGHNWPAGRLLPTPALG